MKEEASNRLLAEDERIHDRLGIVPSSWIATTLGEVFRWGSGGTPKRTISEYYGGGIPWAIIGDLNDGLINDTANTITKLGLESSSARLVPVGSVLLAMYGSIGKLGIAGTEIATNQAIAFSQTGLVFNKYLFWYLRASRNQLITLGKGDTQSNISQTVIKRFPFLLPPLPEQHRIVAEIEKQLTRLDASVAALERVRANLKRYRASVLKTACEGRLVPTEAELARAENRDYEPADRLLQRILAERRARWQSQPRRRGKYKDPAPPDTSTLPRLPEGWAWAILAQISDLKGGVTKGRRYRPDESLTEVPYLRVANVQRGYLDLSEMKTIEVTRGIVNQLKLLPGDILFTEGGDRDKLGRGWVWGGEIEECIHQNHVFRSRLLLNEVRPEFISWWGNSFGQQFFERSGKQTTNLASINLSVLSSFPVPVPPATEQHRIVAEIERRLSVVQQAETVVGASLKRAGRLRQSILKQAFSGKLVPQDPNDEPASALLERIRAERAAASTPSPSTGEGRGEGVPQRHAPLKPPAKAQRKPRRRRSKPAPARQLGFSQEPP